MSAGREMRPESSVVPTVKKMKDRNTQSRWACAAVLALTLLLANLGFGQVPFNEDRNNPFDQSAATVLRLSGFFPEKVTIPPGKIRLKIFNRTSLADLNFVVNEADGDFQVSRAQSSKRTRRRGRSWNDVRTLPVGNYVVTVENYPQWRFEITVANSRGGGQ